MLKFLAYAAGLLVLAFICIAIFFILYGRERSWLMIAGNPDRGRVDLSTVKRSPTANDALACTADLRDDCDFTLPAFSEKPEQLAARIADQVAAADPLARRVDDETDPGHLRFVTYSPRMRFPDLVSFQLVEMPDGQTGVMAYARAQLGQKDFGANRARLEAYLSQV
ncbi:DUF1499 domain-containing protein [Hoeflea prorocentri]|uniref:DUF1499 domain-containing protein n=1 Tax=Hoeflea prorocentri TaxID=1922333 RepID=A0A9X3ZGB8_9HYPH|nr:DUF1499 domain-containing protein [Hoeflea prorocentri]MCY6379575.1 DUF1499 domain-containing protein [Hoeflea prorocentri]MDA5397375.1 DUF1499 domain-containing protein [Hoeflea prorocentri]